MNRSNKVSDVERKARDINKGEETLIRVQANTEEREVCTEEPILRFSEFIRLVKVGRSKAYNLTNPKSPEYDPEFPTGFPLFDSPRSPKGYWRHEGIAWARGRSNKFRNQPR